MNIDLNKYIQISSVWERFIISGFNVGLVNIEIFEIKGLDNQLLYRYRICFEDKGKLFKQCFCYIILNQNSSDWNRCITHDGKGYTLLERKSENLYISFEDGEKNILNVGDRNLLPTYGYYLFLTSFDFSKSKSFKIYQIDNSYPKKEIPTEVTFNDEALDSNTQVKKIKMIIDGEENSTHLVNSEDMSIIKSYWGEKTFSELVSDRQSASLGLKSNIIDSFDELSRFRFSEGFF